MDNLKLTIPIVIVFILAVAGVFYFYQRQGLPNTPFFNATPSPSVVGFPKVKGESSSPGPSPSELPAAGFDTSTVNNIGIVIVSPQQEDKITSPVKISGRANVFEGKVVIRIKNANNQILGQDEATACMDLDACPFKVLVDFNSPQTSTGTIEAFSPSPIDGSEAYLQAISIRF